MKLPARQTLIACGVTLAVASGSIAGVSLMAEDGRDTLAGNTATSPDAVWLAVTQQVATHDKSDRLALPNQAHWILRDQRTAPLEALVWADVIEAPQARAPQAPEQVAASGPQDNAPAAAPVNSFAALTFEPLDTAPSVASTGPMSIVPSPGTAVNAASRTIVQLGDGQPSVQAVAFAPIPAPTAIVPSGAEQDERNLFQQPIRGLSTNRLSEWDIR